MLDALRKFDAETASRILAATALASAPNPGVGEAARAMDVYPHEQQAVLDELRTRLKVQPGDDSVEARSQLLLELSTQISNYTQADKSSEEILKRAGHAGRLSLGLYRIQFTSEFSHYVSLGTKRAHVEDAILRPDQVQHLRDEQAQADDPTAASPFSIFLKFHNARKANDSFWLMVFTQRVGRTLLVQGAWRVYPSDVDLVGAEKPIDVLRAFALRYGFEVKVGDKTSRFISNLVIPLPFGTEIKAYTVLGVQNRYYLGSFSGRSLANSHYVLLAFAIDADSYVEALKSHGVSATFGVGLQPPSSKNEMSINLTSRGNKTEISFG